MPKGYVYILECIDGSYYTGSTTDIEKRLTEHKEGKGANHTKKRLPVKLVYLEEHQRMDDTFYREKQIQGWGRAKKEALIEANFDDLPKLSRCKNESHSNYIASTPLSHKNSTNNHEESHMVAERSRSYRSNGKLLLTAEYLVLDGAKALALPTTFGQELDVNTSDNKGIFWQSFDEKNKVWFEDRLDIDKLLNTDYVSDNEISNWLIQIFKGIHRLNPTFFNSKKDFDIKTYQDFNRAWGLGTSSTLINNLANWANVDAYKLLKLTFGGSGYDIACAQNNSAITYNIKNDKPVTSRCNFNPIFKDCIYFVYLDKKQNSRDAISNYRTFNGDLKTHINEANVITDTIINCKSLAEFNDLIRQHETLISTLINQDVVKHRLFSDFEGEVKSLGAWGGDFVLVTSKNNPKDYFESKGYSTILEYSEMIK